MEKGYILFPFMSECDNKKAFAFTIEFAKKVDADILILAYFELPFSNILSADIYKLTYEKEKEKIHIKILELLGFYQGNYNKWKSINNVKIKCVFKEGNLENVILSVINNQNVMLLLFQQEYYIKNIFSSKFYNSLELNKINILSLPANTDFYETSPNIENELFQVQKKSIFNKMITVSEIYTLPEDINLFRNDIIKAEYY